MLLTRGPGPGGREGGDSGRRKRLVEGKIQGENRCSSGKIKSCTNGVTTKVSLSDRV